MIYFTISAFLLLHKACFLLYLKSSQQCWHTGENMVRIYGNTYPVKDQIKALGGRWSAAEKAWFVPAHQQLIAMALVERGCTADEFYARQEVAQ
ncbi:MAG: DUF5710 domain-containing protein [Pseudomonadota bacterium]